MCSSLESITIGNSVTSIGDGAFYGCSSLESITIPGSVTVIGNGTFCDCISLESITIPDSVKSVGSGAFLNTAYYNSTDNWEDGILFIGNHLICVSEDVTYCVTRGGAIATDAFENCYKLKKLEIGGNHDRILSSLTNIETLGITEIPTAHPILGYFGRNLSDIPITLKNIVIADSVRMNSDAFYGISGLTIYVAATEKDVRWDENFPGWNHGNKVVYGDKWITADFYDTDGGIINSEIFRTSQVIRQPYISSAMDDTYYYEFLGWDMDGDGIDDVIPATSTYDIVAFAVFTQEYRCVLEGHTYDNAYDTTCNVCGYTRTVTHSYGLEWSMDGSQHWHECSVCGNKIETAEHIFDNACDTTCNVCDYTRTITHNYKTEWFNDEAKHWHECSICGEKTDISGHTWDNGTVTEEPTTEAEGLRILTCSVCGQTETEIIAKLKKVDQIVSSDQTVIVKIEPGSSAVLDEKTELLAEYQGSTVAEAVKEKIAEQNGKASVVLAIYDISLLRNGVKVQPGGKVSVTLPRPADYEKYKTLKVIFIGEEGNIRDCETTINHDGSVSFVTDHFSQYGIVGLPDATGDAPSSSIHSGWIVVIVCSVALAIGAVIWIVVSKKKYQTKCYPNWRR